MSETRPHLRVVGDDEPTDATLLSRCVDGDEQAAHRFVLRHQEAVRRFLSRMFGARDPAVDDVAQKTFVAALDSAHRFDGSRAKARTWLFGIASNKARMHLRSRSRRRRAMDLFGTFRRVQPRAAAPDAERAELGRRIQDAIQTLDPDRRTVFVLTELEGLTCREVAASLDTPEGTIRRRRSEARKALQPQLADLREHGGTP